MTSKTSLFNKGLINSNFKRWGWFSALYTLVLFFLLPFNHLLNISNLEHEWQIKQLQRSLDIFNPSLQTILICTVPIILAVLIFQYLNSNKA
ncbi:MAG: ABC transporter permease, partial [Clostridia bacterium]|nr:ABC transporter permease [Clostridia bacterium]